MKKIHSSLTHFQKERLIIASSLVSSLMIDMQLGCLVQGSTWGSLFLDNLMIPIPKELESRNIRAFYNPPKSRQASWEGPFSHISKKENGAPIFLFITWFQRGGIEKRSKLPPLVVASITWGPWSSKDFFFLSFCSVFLGNESHKQLMEKGIQKLMRMSHVVGLQHACASKRLFQSKSGFFKL